MKQILITQEIKAFAKEYNDKLFSNKCNRFVSPEKGLYNLIYDLKELNDKLINKGNYISYIQQIIDDLPYLITLVPSQFDVYKNKYDNILEESFLSTRITCRNMSVSSEFSKRKDEKVFKSCFYEEIVKRMRYDIARSVLGPIMEKMGMNTCVYCNHSKTLYSNKFQEEYYPFDHINPKDKYPFLCISFFNLIPCCTNCNGHKSNNQHVIHQIYTDNQPDDLYKFEVERDKMVDNAPDSVSILFSPRHIDNLDRCRNHDDCFRITECYNSLTDQRENYKIIKDIDKCRASYVNATDASLPNVINKNDLFIDVLGIKNDDNIYTDVKKKLKLDTAKDACLL